MYWNSSYQVTTAGTYWFHFNSTDLFGNLNNTNPWVAFTVDSPNLAITNLNWLRYAVQWAEWNWTNPTTPTYNHTECILYESGTALRWINTTFNTYNDSRLYDNTQYNLSCRAHDIYGGLGNYSSVLITTTNAGLTIEQNTTLYNILWTVQGTSKVTNDTSSTVNGTHLNISLILNNITDIKAQLNNISSNVTGIYDRLVLIQSNITLTYNELKNITLSTNSTIAIVKSQLISINETIERIMANITLEVIPKLNLALSNISNAREELFIFNSTINTNISKMLITIEMNMSKLISDFETHNTTVELLLTQIKNNISLVFNDTQYIKSNPTGLTLQQNNTLNNIYTNVSSAKSTIDDVYARVLILPTSLGRFSIEPLDSLC